MDSLINFVFHNGPVTTVLVILAVIAFFVVPQAIRILREYERGVIFRLGKLQGAKGPGLIILIPIIDKMVKMDLRVVTIDVPKQEIMTKDNVPATVDAVIYFRVVDPNAAVVKVENFWKATSLIAQTTLRSVLGQAPLDDLLSQLSELDPASDVDWVVGLAVAAPRFAASPDDLGIARMPGRHVVLRAMSDAHEYEAITRDFTELSADDRRKLYHVRKQHKLCITFLHEIAHTLAVPHELSAESLMNPRYHVEAGDFSDEAAQIMRAALASRVSPESPLLSAALASQLDTWLRAADSAWEPLSRDTVLRQIAQFQGGPASAATITPTSPKPPQPAPPVLGTVEGLSPEQQRSFDAARAELSAGHAERARQLGAPLFAKYSTLPAVQSLRCDIGMAIGGDWTTISAECPGMSAFGDGK